MEGSIDIAKMNADLQLEIDRANIPAVIRGIGAGFNVFTNSLFECCIIQCTDSKFLNMRNCLILDAYTYFSLVAPLIKNVMTVVRDVFDNIKELSIEDLATEEIMADIANSAKQCHSLLQFLYEIHTTVVAVEKVRKTNFINSLKRTETEMAEAKKAQQVQKNALKETMNSFTKDIKGAETTINTMIKDITNNSDQQQVAVRLIGGVLIPSLTYFIASLEKMTQAIDYIKEKVNQASVNAQKAKPIFVTLKSVSTDISQATLAVSGLFAIGDINIQTIQMCITLELAMEAYKLTEKNKNNLFLKIKEKKDEILAKNLGYTKKDLVLLDTIISMPQIQELSKFTGPNGAEDGGF